MSNQSTTTRSSSSTSAGTSSSSSNEGPRGLRARKLSLSTRQLPLSTATQVSPDSISPGTTTSATIPSSSEIGLGLMLDENGNGRNGVDTATTATSRIGDEADEFFLAATTNSTSTNSGSLREDTTSRTLKRTPSGRLPQLSTVTTSSGSTPSPLQIFTGSPSPSFTSTSPLPSPSVPLARPISPSHHVYNMGGPSTSSSSNGNNPAATTSSYPMSRPPSYNTIMSTSSTAMDRSRSNGSDIHVRTGSLTSACPPVTSSIGGGGYATPKSDVTAFSPASSTGGPRSWRTYDWGSSSSGGEKNGVGEDVREGAKSRVSSISMVNGGGGGGGGSGSGSGDGSSTAGFGSKLLAIPTALLAIFLHPLNAGNQHNYSHRLPYSPNLNGSTSKPPLSPLSSSSSSTKRYPLVIRLLTISYLIFSFLFLTITISSRMFSSPSDLDNSSKSLESRGGQEGWQMMKHYADGLGQKAGIDLSWTHYKANQEGGIDGMGAGGEEKVDEWGTIRRIGHPDSPITDLNAMDPKQNPLTPFTHTYRFSKMHEKVHWDLHDEIVPFAFHASSKPTVDDVTACLYSNPAWLSTLPAFLRSWRGPVSLIFESAHSRLDTSARTALLKQISALRESDTLVKTFVDFHIVGSPRSMSERTLNKTRERMIKNPSALNYQLNLARFFARTDVVFLAGDARLTPSGGLRRRLASSEIRKLVLDRGDAVVVPSFGFVRDPTADPLSNPIPSLSDLRTKVALGPNADEAQQQEDPFNGIGQDEFEPLAEAYVHTLYETLPLPPSEWPNRKQGLVQLVNTRVPSPDTPTTALLALYDRRWDMNHGPTNWYLWRKTSSDPRLKEEASSGGGLGLGLDGTIGGGRQVYKVVDYDLHYSPFVVTSRKGQPWCTERFEDVRAACVYQMYLTGAELWVLPDEWVYTIEPLEKRPESDKQDPADKLRNSISSRLYGKFHQEACMHYGREFLSVAMWDSEKAQHLRETCARTLSSWGMGSG